VLDAIYGRTRGGAMFDERQHTAQGFGKSDALLAGGQILDPSNRFVGLDCNVFDVDLSRVRYRLGGAAGPNEVKFSLGSRLGLGRSEHFFDRAQRGPPALWLDRMMPFDEDLVNRQLIGNVDRVSRVSRYRIVGLGSTVGGFPTRGGDRRSPRTSSGVIGDRGDHIVGRKFENNHHRITFDGTVTVETAAEMVHVADTDGASFNLCWHDDA
jgi:hypothetical protein